MLMLLNPKRLLYDIIWNAHTIDSHRKTFILAVLHVTISIKKFGQRVVECQIDEA